MRLFPQNQVVGIFKGFSEGGLEFHANLILPYKNEFQSIPMHGQFLAVQLENEDEAILGRITSISSEGRLSSSAGEDYEVRAVFENRPIPEDLREQYLKYRVDMRVLGIIRLVNGNLVFAPSHRRLPHVGSKVAFLPIDILQEVAGHNLEGAELGHYALGEFIYCGNDKRLKQEPWMQVVASQVTPHFQVSNLVARRSFVFARAGFGKSNLVKLLFSNLYKETPKVEKRGGRKVPVGSIIFDRDGEYFWPDDKNRPGLCDVPELENQIIVFTQKEGPSPYYQSFVASGIKLDIRRFRPTDVISISLSPEKQDQQNVRKLKGLNPSAWQQLVDEIHINGNAADEKLIKELLQLDEQQDAEMVAARANMTTIVKTMHDPSSQMIDMLFSALKDGKICIIDVSQLRGAQALILSGLLLQRIFDHNQDEFTRASPETIPVIAVIEEAQSIFAGRSQSSGEGPFISWVKEGRKYDLGALMITQQPGSIPNEILSQGDNWFIFHLLSAGDLQAVKKANAHFSDDILSTLLNEPILGHCIYWSSAGGKSYPISTRILSFENLYTARDSKYDMPAGKTYAVQLLQRYERELSEIMAELPTTEATSGIKVINGANEAEITENKDTLRIYFSSAIQKLKNQMDFNQKMQANGLPWRGVQAKLEDLLPDTMEDRENQAYNLVRPALDEIYGKNGWDKERRPSKSKPGNFTTWVVIKKV